MTFVIKLNKGTLERLLKDNEIEEDMALNLTDEEVTLKLKDSEIFIDPNRNDKKLEISDVSGSFGVWFKPDAEKRKRFRKYLYPYDE